MASRSIRADSMLKRHSTLKRHRSSADSLPHDVTDLILVKLPVESLLRFKSVSKHWYSIIVSRSFQQRQLILRMQSRGPDVIYVHRDDGESRLTRIVFGSSTPMTTARLPILGIGASHNSCDGLVCFYNIYGPGFVANPATGWHQRIPLSRAEQVVIETYKSRKFGIPRPRIGFGKDKFSGTYKLVVLYYSFDFGLENVTTCEVFDFITNAWRYVVPASPLEVNSYYKPVYCDGSLYWFTKCEETKVVSFDLHTETFQVVYKTPFAHVSESRDIVLSSLDNRLCVSKMTWPRQDIWLLGSSSGGWNKMCSLDLTKTVTWYNRPLFPLTPIAIPDKDKLLITGHVNSQALSPLVIHDLRTNSYDAVFEPTIPVGSYVYYFESLVSPLST